MTNSLGLAVYERQRELNEIRTLVEQHTSGGPINSHQELIERLTERLAPSEPQ
jgi:hypothetical protein